MNPNTRDYVILRSASDQLAPRIHMSGPKLRGSRATARFVAIAISISLSIASASAMLQVVEISPEPTDNAKRLFFVREPGDEKGHTRAMRVGDKLRAGTELRVPANTVIRLKSSAGHQAAVFPQSTVTFGKEAPSFVSYSLAAGSAEFLFGDADTRAEIRHGEFVGWIRGESFTVEASSSGGIRVTAKVGVVRITRPARIHVEEARKEFAGFYEREAIARTGKRTIEFSRAPSTLRSFKNFDEAVRTYEARLDGAWDLYERAEEEANLKEVRKHATAARTLIGKFNLPGPEAPPLSAPLPVTAPPSAGALGPPLSAPPPAVALPVPPPPPPGTPPSPPVSPPFVAPKMPLIVIPPKVPAVK